LAGNDYIPKKSLGSTLKRFKELISPFLPPILIWARQEGNFKGDYSDWSAASSSSTGYDSDGIVQKVLEAAMKVKTGQAAYERDSVLFDRIEYSWPLLAALLWIASRSENLLNILDFGGGLGSSYRQNRKFLAHLRVRWNIVEQKKFADCGKKFFRDEPLAFYDSLDECVAAARPASILLSSVLPYLERPYDLLGEIDRHRFKYVIIDKTPFLDRGGDRLTVQHVPPSIYAASYPCWIFNESKFLDRMKMSYELIERFDAYAGTVVRLGDASARFKGFIFERTDG